MKIRNNFSYSIEEEQFLAEQFYKSKVIDYEKIMYGESRRNPGNFEQEDEYSVESNLIEETGSLALTMEEAEKTIIQIQNATITGATYDVSEKDRRKLDLWIKFNPALFQLYETIHGLTRDVNYGLLV